MNINAISGYFGQMINNPQKIAQELSSRIIAKKDANGDGKLTIQELGKKEAQFQKADINNDKLLTKDELITTLTDKIHSRNQELGNSLTTLNSIKSVLGKLSSEGQGLPTAKTITEKIFERKDSDHNGLLSAEEMGHRADMFAFADTDKDGSISKDETMDALKNREQSINALSAYASNQGMSLKNLLISKLDISDKEADKILSILDRNTLEIRA